MSETLLNEIRATKPAAPAALRERVRAIAATEPARDPFLARFDGRPDGNRARRAGGARRGGRSRRSVIGLTRERRAAVSGEATPPAAGEATTTLDGNCARAATEDAVGATRALACRPRRPTRPSSHPCPASSSATRPSCVYGRRRRGALERRRSARSRSPSRSAATSPRSRTTPRPRASARRRSRCASRPRGSQSAMAQLSAARHDRRPALRDRGSPAAGRHLAGADRERRSGRSRSSSRGSRSPTLGDDRVPSCSPGSQQRAPNADRPPGGLRATNAEARIAHDLPHADDRADRSAGAAERRPARRHQGRPRLGGDRRSSTSSSSPARSSCSAS